MLPIYTSKIDIEIPIHCLAWGSSGCSTWECSNYGLGLPSPFSWITTPRGYGLSSSELVDGLRILRRNPTNRTGRKRCPREKSKVMPCEPFFPLSLRCDSERQRLASTTHNHNIIKQVLCNSDAVVKCTNTLLHSVSLKLRTPLINHTSLPLQPFLTS